MTEENKKSRIKTLASYIGYIFVIYIFLYDMINMPAIIDYVLKILQIE